MKWIQNNKKTYNWISTFPTDTPFFTKKELIKFYKNINYTESKLFFMKSGNTRHNIFSLWSIDLINSLEKDLLNNEKKVETWANKKGVRTIEIDFNDKDPFFNINTIEDYEKAKEMIKND